MTTSGIQVNVSTTQDGACLEEWIPRSAIEVLAVQTIAIQKANEENTKNFLKDELDEDGTEKFYFAPLAAFWCICTGSREREPNR